MINCFGTRYRLHPLFVLLMAVSVWTGYFLELATLFGIVVIHETGHVLAARSFGWKVTEVQLLPFGGVAVVEETNTVTAREEIIVALAGPLMNGWMILLAYFMVWTELWSASWTAYFVNANLFIGLFNLLPVLPLDGGRVTQALISRFVAYYVTLKIGVSISLTISILLVTAALTKMAYGRTDLNLLAIALFLLATNIVAYRQLYYRFIRFLVGRSERTDRMLRSGNPLLPIAVREAFDPPTVAKLLRREKYHLIYIMNDKNMVLEVLTEEKLVDCLLSDSSPGQFVLK